MHFPTGKSSLPAHEASINRASIVSLPIFWRLALGSLMIICVVMGVTLYALGQLRELSSVTSRLVTHHVPAMESGKQLLASLYSQLREEKKYLAVGDRQFLTAFEQEAAHFDEALSGLQTAEASEQGRALLRDIGQDHQAYRQLVDDHVRSTGRTDAAERRYETGRDQLMSRMTDTIQRYVALQETNLHQAVDDARTRASAAEAVTQRLILAAVVLGLAFAGLVSYSILHPLRRVQAHIRRIGQGQFGTSVEVAAPSELRELVKTVNWMGSRLQELDEMKAQFFANVSHELRTPLTSIRAGTSLLLEGIPGPLTPDQRETVQILSTSADRLNRLISTLLDLSKIEAGMMEFQFASTDLRDVVEQALKKVKLIADSKQLSVRLEGHAGPIWLPADPGRMEQVFDNLLSNAIKFSPSGSSIEVRLDQEARSGFLRASVTDAGPGIPVEDVPHIFDRFYQVRRGERQKQGGSGLGLALVKHIIDAHSGEIWIESIQGRGTSVRFDLPLEQAGRAA